MVEPAHTDGIHVILENFGLWKKFNDLGTEMIITKPGRRMFPYLELSFKGFKPEEMYIVLLEIYPLGDKKYKYNENDRRWNETDCNHHVSQHPAGVYIHPEGPFLGRRLEKRIDFQKVKLTNFSGSADLSGHILLESMCRYVPRVTVMTVAEFGNKNTDESFVFSFKETEFIAVTSYMNRQIAKLKIDYNPFATGFRQDGLHGRKINRGKNSPEVREKGDSDEGESQDYTLAQSDRYSSCSASPEESDATQSFNNVLYSVPTNEVNGDTIQVMHVNPSSIVVTDVPPSPPSPSVSPKSCASSTSSLDQDSDHEITSLPSAGASSIPNGFIVLENTGHAQNTCAKKTQPTQVNMGVMDGSKPNQVEMEVVNVPKQKQVKMKVIEAPIQNQSKVKSINEPKQKQLNIIDESICRVTNVRSIREPEEGDDIFNDKQVNLETNSPQIESCTINKVIDSRNHPSGVETSSTGSVELKQHSQQERKSIVMEGLPTNKEMNVGDDYSRVEDRASLHSEPVKGCTQASTEKMKHVQIGRASIGSSMDTTSQENCSVKPMVKESGNEDTVSAPVDALGHSNSKGLNGIRENKHNNYFISMSNEPEKETIRLTNSDNSVERDTQISKLLRFVNNHPMTFEENAGGSFARRQPPTGERKRATDNETVKMTKRIRNNEVPIKTEHLDNDSFAASWKEQAIRQSNWTIFNQTNAISSMNQEPLGHSNAPSNIVSDSLIPCLTSSAASNDQQLNEHSKSERHPEKSRSLSSTNDENNISREIPTHVPQKDTILTQSTKDGTLNSDIQPLECSKRLDYEIADNKGTVVSCPSHGGQPDRSCHSRETRPKRLLDDTYCICKGVISKKPALTSNQIRLSTSDAQKAIIKVESEKRQTECSHSEPDQHSSANSSSSSVLPTTAGNTNLPENQQQRCLNESNELRRPVTASSVSSNLREQNECNSQSISDGDGENIIHDSAVHSEALSTTNDSNYPMIVRTFSLRPDQETPYMQKPTEEMEGSIEAISWGFRKTLPKHLKTAATLQDRHLKMFLQDHGNGKEIIYNTSQRTDSKPNVPEASCQSHSPVGHPCEYEGPEYLFPNQHEVTSAPPYFQEEIRLETLNTFSSQFSRDRAPDPRLPEIYCPTRTTFTCYSYRLIPSALPIIPQCGHSSKTQSVDGFGVTHENRQPEFDAVQQEGSSLKA